MTLDEGTSDPPGRDLVDPAPEASRFLRPVLDVWFDERDDVLDLLRRDA
jgi:hypothetical protein